MIGDSTMSNKPLEGNQERGWGHVFKVLSRRCPCGESCDERSKLEKVLSMKDVGNLLSLRFVRAIMLFIQFGHNDEKPQPERHTDPGTTFDENSDGNLFVKHAKGGNPVLFNSIVRRNFGV